MLLGLAGLAATSLCSAAPARPVQSARAVLEQCVEQAGQDVRGLEDLKSACPGIEAAIQELHLDPQLPADWEQHVGTGALSNWSALADRYASTGTPAQGLLEPGRLREIARALPVPVSRSTLTQDWLHRWLRRWLHEHPQWLAALRSFLSGWYAPLPLQGVLYGLLLLVVLAATAIVYQELRAAGVLGSPAGERPPRRRLGKPPGAAEEPPGTLELAMAPPHLRPVLVLRTLVAALTRSHRLEYERALTCRELVTSALFDTDAQRQHFAALSVLAERGLYGDPGQEPPPQQDAVLAAAQSLEAQLLAPPKAQDAS